MKASVLDLRNHMNDVIKALDRNERVTLTYRGKPKAIILPISKNEKEKPSFEEFIQHPFFGMYEDEEKSVEEIMDELRGGRYRHLYEESQKKSKKRRKV